MSTIVQHYDKKTGKTRVYESTPHYDPVTKQSRPKRKYLGTLDTETGELIPSSERRGRTPSSKNKPTNSTNEVSIKISDLEKIISNNDAEIDALKSEISSLKMTIKSYSKMYESISSILAKGPGCL